MTGGLWEMQDLCTVSITCNCSRNSNIHDVSMPNFVYTYFSALTIILSGIICSNQSLYETASDEPISPFHFIRDLHLEFFYIHHLVTVFNKTTHLHVINTLTARALDATPAQDNNLLIFYNKKKPGITGL